MQSRKTKAPATKRPAVRKAAAKKTARHRSSFSKCTYLMARHGSEETFRAVAGGEIGALSSSARITDFLKGKAEELAKAAGGKALQWVTAELLKAFGAGGSPTDLDEIKSILLRVIELEEQILSKLEDVLNEVKFQHLITRSFDAVESILSIYDRLQRLSLVKGEAERERIANEIKKDVLDGNQGIFISLRKINAVLTGKGPLSGGDSLIKVFADRWFKSYTATQLRADVPLSAYWKALDQWLHELSVIQYMGTSALANARIANGDFETLEGELDAIVQNMKEQQALMDDEIPEWTRTLPEEALSPDAWFVIRGYGINNRPATDDSEVFYGPPASDLSDRIRFRWRNWWNWDEEWNLAPVNRSVSPVDNDTFRLHVRTGNVQVVYDKELKMFWGQKNPNYPVFRLVMGRSKASDVTDNTPRSKAYLPIMGFVGTSNYVVQKSSSGSILTTQGTEDKAIRFRFERV